MKFIKQTKFWQLPVDIKFVVICFFLLGLSSFWETVSLYIETKSTLELGGIIRGFIEWALAIGLINRSDEARQWAAFFAFLGFLIGTFLLTIAIFPNPNPTVGFNISFNQSSQSQTIVLLMTYIILCVIILFILLNSKTKEFFANNEVKRY